MNVAVRNPNLQGMAIKQVPLLNGEAIVCSRLKRGELLMVPAPHERLELGDYLHLVGKREDLENARLVIGEEVDASLSTRGTALQVVRAVVTNEQVLGKKIRDLNLKQKYDVVISRLNRAGVELVAGSNVTLQFGDILNLVGRPEAIDAVTAIVGNAQQKLQQVQMLPVFIGIGLGVLLGSIPLFVPGFPAALRLGLAGGPLVAALIPGAHRQHRQAVLVYAAERQPGAARTGHRAVSGGGWIEIGRQLHRYVVARRGADVGRVRRADHRHSAAERRYSGAHGGQDELSDAVRHAGGIDDRSAGAGVRQRSASHQRRRRAVLRHRVSAGDVPAHHVAAAAGGAVLDAVTLPDYSR